MHLPVLYSSAVSGELAGGVALQPILDNAKAVIPAAAVVFKNVRRVNPLFSFTGISPPIPFSFYNLVSHLYFHIIIFKYENQ
jgi:hypothetical protein